MDQCLKFIGTLVENENVIWSLDFNEKHSLIALSGPKQNVQIIKYSEYGNECEHIYEHEHGHQKSIRNLAWSPCGTYLALSSFDSSVSIWKLDSDKINLRYVDSIKSHENEVKCVCWHKKFPYLATCSRDKSVWIWKCISSTIKILFDAFTSRTYK